MFWGKILGAFFGYLLGGFPGAVIGLVAGHLFDQGLKRTGTTVWQHSKNVLLARETFFKATFQLMGCLAKADGRVSHEEINIAEIAIQRMQLNQERRRSAIENFNIGKQNEFDYSLILQEFAQECGRSHDLVQFFFEFLVAISASDGEVDPRERAILNEVAVRLRFSTAELDRVLQMMLATLHFKAKQQHHAKKSSKNDLQDAYMLLGVSENASDDEIKKAYRKLMNQHHPDKLAAKGLPTEMLQMATEKTQHIKQAYEIIKEYRSHTRP